MKIALLGDAAFYGKFSVNNENIKEYLHSTSQLLKDFDYVVLNLEAPFAKNNAKRYGSKSAYIKSDPLNIEILHYLGVNAVCLANNHMFDYGYESFELTKKILCENGIDYFGVENKNLKINLLGNKISFNGYCCFSANPINATKNGVNPLDFKVVERDLIEDNQLGYSSIISSHAGQEHVNYPNYDHIEMARKLSEIKSYVYYGHHPHVLQGIEEFNNSIIAYSLGNFCFDDVYTEKSMEPLVKMDNNNKESAILSLEYFDSKLIKYEMIPLFDGQECVGNRKEKILKNISKYSEELKREKVDYIKKRAILLNTYITSRKKKRDITWYLKRLNLNSIVMKFNSFNNRKKYNDSVKNIHH